MRKLLVLLLVLASFLASGCKEEAKVLVDSTTTPIYEDLVYDDLIIEWGLDVVSEEFEDYKYPNRVYEVSKDGELYVVNVDGDVNSVIVPKSDKVDWLEIKNEQPLTDVALLELFQVAKEKIYSYIDSSKILKEKDSLKKKISKINIMSAETVNVPADYLASAMYRNGTVYICTFSYSICEWELVHELVHALADITNGGMQNHAYFCKNFDEALTDIIVCAIAPYLPSHEYISGYLPYYPNILAYIGVFREEAIKAYFYGYEAIWYGDKTNKDEFDFFVSSFNNFYNEDVVFAQVAVNNSLLKWAGMFEAE